MGTNQGPPRVSLPRTDAAGAQRRDRGVRGARHLSNWTIAALVVGVGATSAVLARSTQSATSTVGSVTGTTTSHTIGTAGAPTVHSPVTLTTPSGVVIQSTSTGGASASGASTSPGGRRVVYGGDT
jgi:hypothetical protein